jgi:hypothetical protein
MVPRITLYIQGSVAQVEAADTIKTFSYCQGIRLAKLKSQSLLMLGELDVIVS